MTLGLNAEWEIPKVLSLLKSDCRARNPPGLPNPSHPD